MDTLCPRANICPVSQSSRDTGRHRRTERIWPVNPARLENANRTHLLFLFHAQSPCCGSETSPDVGPDKNVANHGLPVRGAASLITLPLERLRRNARAGPLSRVCYPPNVTFEVRGLDRVANERADAPLSSYPLLCCVQR